MKKFFALFLSLMMLFACTAFAETAIDMSAPTFEVGEDETEYEVDGASGYNVVTTIDYKIQAMLEQQVMDTFYDNNSMNRCCGIVMDVNTGAVLAMANLSSYDPNNYAVAWIVDGEAYTWTEGAEEKTRYCCRQKCPQDLFKCGGTFKF